jgi:hypothetical protein
MADVLFIPTIFGFGLDVYIILVVLGIPIYFIFRRRFKKRIQSTRKRKIVTWVSTILVTPLVYITIVAITFFCMEYYPNKDFDRQQWLTDKEERYEFAKDIVNSNMLIGKTKLQVEKILGNNSNPNENDYWYYDLGYRPELFNIDPDNLEIGFKNDKVILVEWHKR